MKTITLLIAVVVALCLPARAQQSEANTTAYRASVSQTQLQSATDQMKNDLAAIMRDYEHYEIAAVEIAKLKESVGSLDTITARNMPDVVRLLLVASHSGEAALVHGNIAQASGQQKLIQTRLRTLADQLALYSNQAAMQKRIEELAVRQSANLRATRELTKDLTELGITPAQLASDVAAMPAKLPRPERDDLEGIKALRLAEKKQNLMREHSRRQMEQSTLVKETGLAVEALAKVVEDPLAADVTHFKQALEVAKAGKIDEHSRAAATAMDRDYARSAAEQESVFNTLQTVIASLDAAKSDEERLRDIANQLGDLSLKEDGLANLTPNMWGEQKNRATRDQLGIADRMDVLQNRIKSLDAESSTKAAESTTQAAEIGDTLRPENFRDNIPLVARTVDSQNSLARDLSAMSRTLQQKAEKIAAAAAAQSGADPQEPKLSPEAAAIQDAMRQLVDARINVDLAGRMNDTKGDFKPRVGQAQQNMSAGSEQAKAAGPIVGEDVHAAIAEAQRLADLAANGTQVGHNLYHTRANINKALAGLQEAAMQLAAQQAQAADGPGEGGGNTSTALRGGPIYSNLADASDAQRDALLLLKQEKTAPEFAPLVNQYIKNLATETDANP
ncbi:MAG: hypothetical protein WCK77_06485 [Verrucomicrobiota bacterium]